MNSIAIWSIKCHFSLDKFGNCLVDYGNDFSSNNKYGARKFMSANLKRCTSAMLVAVLLMVGFLAELTHHHAIATPGQAKLTSRAESPPDNTKTTQHSDVCFVCQVHSFAVESFVGCNIVVPPAGQQFSNLGETFFASLFCPSDFLRRGPPAVFA